MAELIVKVITFRSSNLELLIGAKGEDSSKMLRIFFVRCFAAEAFLVLREIVLGGEPTGEVEATEKLIT
ncbi:hypothetical protein [Bacillus sp. RO1]|uniref:hypothetical protein n=1 Tax=Bacillus sp. RO1 TaxID=2722703 RepID=UPI0014572AA8|nr:hypothetical protein [Bacillus sp. RO1]NLP49115.1 hypothetical protein [Bacillus sp. RO1]